MILSRTPCAPLLLAWILAGAAQGQVARAPRPLVGSAEKLLVHYERWSARDGADGPLVVPLGWERGRSAGFTRARGAATLDLERGVVGVAVEGLTESDLGGAEALDVWLGLLGRGAPEPPAPVRLGSVGVVAGAGALAAAIPRDLAGAELEELWLARPAVGDRGDEVAVVLSGAPDLFQRMAALERTRARELSGRAIGGIPLLGRARGDDGKGAWSAEALDELVADGERLFFEETFAGNGRTCGTCHRAENDFTIDPAFIATLPDDDPLFVAERVPALDWRRNGGLVFESPEHMRRLGLIVVNADGFDDLAADFVLRAVQPTLGLAATIEPAPRLNQPFRHVTGWAGDGSAGRGSLREFALGAVRQHFPRTLERRAGVDFRLPRSEELSALEAFQLSLGRTEDPDLTALSFTDPGVRRGVQLFFVEGLCNACHANGGSRTNVGGTQGDAFVDTGVEALTRRALGGTALPHPPDGGFGTRDDGGFDGRAPRASGGYGNGRFNAPSLIELADTLPAFHSHVTADPAAGLPDTVEGAVAFYLTDEFVDSEVGGGFLQLDLSPADVDDIGRLLRVLNALENVRTVDEYAARALAESAVRKGLAGEARVRRLIDLALLEGADAVRVLGEVGLHPGARLELAEAEGHLRRARSGPAARRRAELEAARGRLAAARADVVD